MPARSRQIGPEVSTQVAKVLRAEREKLNWSRNDLSLAIAEAGYSLGASAIQNIENGVRMTAGNKYQRLVTVDEVHVLMQVLGRDFAQQVADILLEDT